MKQKRSATRRSFLRAVGAGAVALPFYRLLEDHFAKAYGETLPLRFIGVYHPHGIAAEYFVTQYAGNFPSGTPSGVTDTVTTSGGVATSTNFSLQYANCPLQPFDDATTYGKSYKSQVCIIEGIDHLSNANGHNSAGTIFTGSTIDESALKPANSSIDQFLAVENNLGAATPVTSIQLGVGDNGTQSGTTLSYSKGGIALPKIPDPVQAFNALFGNFAAPNNAAAQAALARQQQLGTAVASSAYADVQSLYNKLASAEQQKLQAHLDALSDLKKSFAATTLMGANCQVPAKPNSANFPDLLRYQGGEPYFDAISKAHIGLLAQAFACDITRFATLFLGDLSYAANPLMLPADNHGSMAHVYDGSSVGSDGEPVGNGTVSTWQLLAKFNKYIYGLIATLMQQLDTMGVLENTLIYVSSDMGNPARHSTRNVPTVLAGGANGLIQMGRRLKMTPDCPSANLWCGPTDGVKPTDYTPITNNHLLVSIANLFGVEVTTFGTQPNASDYTGPLPGL
ncbi:MAG TPA: DUF1552 domain-containing protein [Polyangia bacterium]|nr:DUF1552 domain-containing protein [Polyangia bacterium]